MADVILKNYYSYQNGTAYIVQMNPERAKALGLKEVTAPDKKAAPANKKGGGATRKAPAESESE